MAYSEVPTRSSTDTNASADINQLQDNIQGAAIEGLYANAIINGEMRISQRGTTFTNVANGELTLDRWVYEKVSTAVHTITQDTDTPSTDIFNYSLKADCTTADASIASSDIVVINQKIEGYNFAPYIGKTFYLKFWVKSTITGTYCIGLTNSAQNRSYTTEYTINAADTWEQKTITITHDSTGTWVTNNGMGLQVSWVLASGTNFHGTADTWTAGLIFATSNQVNVCNSTDNNFYLTGIQLSLNDHEYTPRDIGTEIAFCQRYFWKQIGADTAITVLAMWTATDSYGIVQYPTSMRTTPTITESAAGFGTVLHAGSSTTTTALVEGGKTTEQAELIIQVAAGLTAGQAGWLRLNTTNYIDYDAEL
jgi:hypothetical protein